MVGSNYDPTKQQDPQRLKFDYIKSQFFRVIKAEGIWGCVTPSFGIQIAFWNERFPIPDRVEYKVLDDGEMEEDKREIRDAIVREVEASVVIDVETAEMLISWLKERVEEIEQLQSESSTDEG